MSVYTTKAPVTITCHKRLAPFLEAEVRELGFEIEETFITGVKLHASINECIILNLNLRCASQILYSLKAFHASDADGIYNVVKNLAWEKLLHDGGYRDFMPSGPFGAYRADYFHNRVVARDGKIALGQKQGQYRFASPERAAVPGQGLLDFFRNSGAYRPVRTQKIDFLALKHFDLSRTRLIDDHLGYEADRIINYVKELDWFVVFDVIRFKKDTYLTLANLWHTRKISAQGEGWYDTTYDSLQTMAVSGSERKQIR